MQFYDIEQNTDEWLDLRLGKATASNFGCFMANDGKAFGEPAKRYALKLALERMNGKRSDYGFSTFTNEHTERGHEQEPIARMLYEEETFCAVSNGGFFCHGEYGDSPDGLVGGNDDSGGGSGDGGVIEIKSVVDSTHYETLKRGNFDPAYRWQLIGHLDCTGRSWVDFVSYCADFPVGKQLCVLPPKRPPVTVEKGHLLPLKVSQ